MAYDFLTTTGVIVPDTQDLASEVEAEWKQAFGQDLTVTPDTPQGVMITAEVIAREGVAANNAAVANQINPNLSGGVFLDAICALLGLEREGATATRVPAATLGGVPGTVVPAGSRARNVAGDIYETANNVMLDGLGVAVVDLVALLAGPRACPVGTLNEVVDQVLGWETITNTLPALIGNLEQSDGSLKQLRKVTLARQGISTREAQASNINDLPGVLSSVFRENYNNTDATIDGVFLKANSVWTGVDGGASADIAATLLRVKTDGAGWNGAETVPVVDPDSGQTYNVQFDRATYVPVSVRITVRKGTSVFDPTAVVPQAIADYANGLIPDERGLPMGVDVSPFEIASAVNYYYPGMTVINVQLASGNNAPTTQTIPITLKQRALIDPTYVTVVVQ